MDESSLVLLVVDDDDDVRESLKLMLEDEGYSVVLAGNGEHALRELRAGLQPHLILLDLMMPVMSGWEFLSRHQASVRGDIPVLILTAADIKDTTIDRAQVLPKTIDRAALLDVIRISTQH